MLTFAVSAAAAAATANAAAMGAASYPNAILATPAPSSLWLLLAGLVVLAGWNWWRRRTRQV
jgi:PEP-CTERM motif